MNHEHEAAALAALCHAADIVATCGAQYARKDDPHRYALLPREFDGGKARRRLVLDYLARGQIRITLLFIGTQGGEERVAELFSTLVQGPVDEVKQ
jgi:hypothetical protein